MELNIRQVETKRDLRTYIYLPEAIHAGHKNWMPPLYMDEWTYYNPRKNKAFSYCDTILLLAFRGDRPVGRIMGIIHHPYNKDKGIQTVRFAHFDCYDDEEVARALLRAIEDWGREKGMNEVVGPFGFSDKDPEGFMVEGFEKMPILVTNCNLPYMSRFMEGFRYEKKVDCLGFMIDIENELPKRYPTLFEKVRQRSPLRVKEFKRKKELRPYIEPVFHLMNKTYNELYGFMPLDEREIREMASRYLPILDVRYVKLALNKDNEVVGFVIGLLNMSKGIQQAHGRLFPFGFLHIIRSARQTRQLDIMLGAVHPEYRNRGLHMLVGWSLIQSAHKAGITNFEVHLVLETNTPMLAVCNKFGGKPHKRFRIYRKDLNIEA